MSRSWGAGMDELVTGHVAAAAAQNLTDRAGYDAGVLGPAVSIPTLPGTETVLLAYTRFLVLMRPDERLAAVTALNMDGIKMMDLGRTRI